MAAEKIFEVDSVRLYTLEEGKRLLIVATGQTSTTGWTRAELKPYIYAKPPADGIWEYSFLAEPPSGPAAEVLSPIWATAIWDCPSDAKGVRIHAAANAHERKIEMAAHDRDSARRAFGKDGPFPTAVGGESPFPWFTTGTRGGDKPYPGPLIVLGGDKPFPWGPALFGGEKPLPWQVGGEKPYPWATRPFNIDGVIKPSAGIGGETTGHALTDIALDVDVESIVNGTTLQGKRARYSGYFVHRHYVERGWVTTFVVTDVVLLK